MSSSESVEDGMDARILPPLPTALKADLEEWPTYTRVKQNEVLFEAVCQEAQLFKDSVEAIKKKGTLPPPAFKRALISQLALLITVINDCETS